MVTLTDARLRHTVYQAIYAKINTDKSSYNTTGTPKLYGSNPDDGSVTFPYIIIRPIKAPESEFTVDTSRNVSTKNITVSIELYSLKNEDIDNLADGVAVSVRGLAQDGMFIIGMDEDDGLVLANNAKVKQKTLTYVFLRR